MSVEVEILEEDWILGELIQSPVLFREFLNYGDPNWFPLEIHERAWTTCTSHFVSMCCGRGVHKTTAMIELLYWWMINGMFNLGDQGLFVLVPNKAQKDLTFGKIRAACEGHWLIKNFVRSINIQEGLIKFTNGFEFLLRIAGESGKESNVIGLHTYRIWVDEAQDIPYRTWLSLQNCLKEEIPGYQMFVSGVPNGGRQENVLYMCDQYDDKYTRFNVSQELMTRWWTPELQLAKRIQYRAMNEDTEDYKHYVLGQHGAPTFSVFDRHRFQKAPYKFEKLVLTQHSFETAQKINADGSVSYRLEDIIVCPPVPSEYGIRPRIGIGYDPGFSPDPAVFFIMYQDPKEGTWRNLIRYVLQRVEYGFQREVLNWLDKVYSFDFIGIDMGGIGKVQYQDLTGETSIYKDRSFSERIFPVEFGGQMVVAIDEQGNEKKDLIKRIAVEALSKWVYERRFVFSEDDDDLMTELERTKFTRTITGEPVYRTEDDHQMSAMMCAILAYENRFGIPIAKSMPNLRLLSARWLDIDDELGVLN